MKQFGRQVKLYLGNDHESIECSPLRIIFEISKTITAEPNPAKISIYNLNESNRNAILSKQYDKAILAVGYDELRTIYAGDIVESEARRSELDIITDLECGDGAKDFIEARVNATLSSGRTDRDILQAATNAMTRTTQGAIDLSNNRALPRGKVLVGNARDVLDKVAINNQANWSIQDGALIMLPEDKVLNDEGFFISKNTGMVGSPEKTSNGLKVTCLLNPALMIGGLIRVESNMKNFNGDYKVTELIHKGDYMSDMWYSEIICIGGEFQKVKK